jgi:amino acid permease
VIFGFIGVEILIVAAGEAKNARRDLPKATSYTYIITIILYFISALVVSFNVGYDDPELSTYGSLNGAYTSTISPFIIAMNRSTLSKQVAATFKWFFFFSAATTA